MRIAGVASAFPQNYYSQAEIAAALKRHWSAELDNPEVLDRMLARVGVDGRHLALAIDRYDDLTDWGEKNNHWINVAEDLAEQSICRALTRAGLCEQDLDAIFFVSVTGVASPSIDARLINRMNLRPNIKRVPIFGLGCVAGAAGIARAADYVRAYPEHTAVLVSVELCSLTWQRKDLSVANLISSGLFGDGSAAVIVSGAARDAIGPLVIATSSSFYRGTEDVMGWDISSDGFNIVLSNEVPNMVRKHLAHDVDAFLVGAGTGARRHRNLDYAHRRAQSAGGHGRGAWPARRSAAGVVGLPGARGQSVVGLGVAGAGRVHEPAASRCRVL